MQYKQYYYGINETLSRIGTQQKREKHSDGTLRDKGEEVDPRTLGAETCRQSQASWKYHGVNWKGLLRRGRERGMESACW